MELTVGGKRVRASTGGAPITDDKPLIVFAHGVSCDRTVWSMVTRAFAHHGYSVLAVDLPGHGASEGPPLPSVEAMRSSLLTSLITDSVRVLWRLLQKPFRPGQSAAEAARTRDVQKVDTPLQVTAIRRGP